MKMNKTKIFAITLMIMMCLMTFLPVIANAATSDDGGAATQPAGQTGQDGEGGGSGGFLNPGSYPGKGRDTGVAGDVSKAAGQIYGLVQIAAMGVAVIMLIVLAVKYMMASPDGKAEIKKSAYIYIVGAILLFGATGIIALIQTFATDNLK
jgi:type IV secretory pathway VirB2 component (pilin)